MSFQHWTLRLTTSVLSVLFGLHAGASVSNQSELQRLLQVSSLQALESEVSRATERDLLRDACQAELKARIIPRSCFKRSIDLVESARLTRICVKSARSSRSRLDLAGENDVLPLACRQVASERLEDLLYIDEDRSPEQSEVRPHSQTSGRVLE